MIWLFDPGNKYILKVKKPMPDGKSFVLSTLTDSTPVVYYAGIHDLQDFYLIETVDISEKIWLWYKAKSSNELKNIQNQSNQRIQQVIKAENVILVITQEQELKRVSTTDFLVEDIPILQPDESIAALKLHQTKLNVFLAMKNQLFKYVDKRFVSFISLSDSRQPSHIDAIYDFNDGLIAATDKGLYFIHAGTDGKQLDQLIKDENDSSLSFGGTNKSIQTHDGDLLFISYEGNVYLTKQLDSKHINLQKVNPFDPAKLRAKAIYQTNQGIFITTDKGLYKYNYDRAYRVNNEKQLLFGIFEMFGDELLSGVGSVKSQITEKDNPESNLIVIEATQGLFQVVQCSPLSLSILIASVMGAFIYCLIVAITARYKRKAFYLLVNAPTSFCFWSRFLLLKWPRYRQWIFQLYLEEKQKEFPVIKDSGKFRDNAASLLIDLNQKNHNKINKIWLCEQIEANIDCIIKDMKEVFFSEENIVQSILKYRFIPIFISMSPNKLKGNINETNFLLGVVAKELQISNIKFLTQLLSCRDFVLIFYPFYVNNQRYALDKLLEKAPTASMIVVSQNNSPYPAWQPRRFTPPPSDIFISHSSKDITIATKLGAILEEKGWSVWLDKEDLRAGVDYPEEINKEVSTARCVIVLLSYESLKSKWVKLEIGIAEKRGEALEPKILLPIMIEEPKTPEHIELFEKYKEQYHMRNFIGWDGELDYDELNRLIDDITHTLTQ